MTRAPISGAAIVIIGHRMHPDDLQGRLIEQMKAGGDYADQWTIINLPAIAQAPSELNDWIEDPMGRRPGEALWNEWYPLPALERIRRNTAFPRYWSSLYLQNPIPDEEGGAYSIAPFGAPSKRCPQQNHGLIRPCQPGFAN
jgi:hypothetical protein